MPSIAIRDDIDRPEVRFGIDDAIRDLWNRRKLTDHWKTEEQALRFGRFALDKCIHQALGAAERLQMPSIVDDWTVVADRAQRAHKALLDLISWSTSSAYAEAGERALVPPFRQMAATRGERIETGERYAETIASAERILADYAEFAAQKRKSAAALSQNPGEPVLAEFILRMAETWYLLTGKVPGKNARLESNRFLQFAKIAWEDAGGEVPVDASTFAQSALARATASLKGMDGIADGKYRPFWAQS